jgi:hypothetical protein
VSCALLAAAAGLLSDEQASEVADVTPSIARAHRAHRVGAPEPRPNFPGHHRSRTAGWTRFLVAVQ